jgi:hypothetical protein
VRRKLLGSQTVSWIRQGAALGDDRGIRDIFEVFVDIRKITLAAEFLRQKVSNLLDFAVERRMIRPCAGENHDTAKSALWPADMAIPETDRDLVGAACSLLDRVGKWAIGEQKMEAAAIGPRNHGNALGETAQECLLALECAVRA